MKMRNKLLDYSIAEILIKLFSIVGTLIIIKLVNAEDYGSISVFMSLYSVASIASLLGIPGSILRWYHDDQDSVQQYVKVNTLVLFVVNALVLVILYGFRSMMATLLNIEILTFVALLIALLPNILFTMYCEYLRSISKTGQYSLLRMISAFISIFTGLIIVVLMDENRFYGRIIGVLISNYALFIYILPKYLKLKLQGTRSKTEYIHYGISYGLPLMPHKLSSVILSVFDRVMVNTIIGTVEAGMYSFSYTMAGLVHVLTDIFVKWWTPNYFKWMKEEKKNWIQEVSKNFYQLFVLLICLPVMFFNEFVVLFGIEAYKSSYIVFVILIANQAVMFLYTIYAGYLFYSKKTIIISRGTIVSGIVNIILNSVLIPRFGYQVAALTTFISFGVLLLLQFYSVKRVYNNSMVKLRHYYYPTIVLVIMLISIVMIQYSSLTMIIQVTSKIGIWLIGSMLLNLKETLRKVVVYAKQ